MPNLGADAAQLGGAGVVPTARLGTGAASASTYLRGDSSWASTQAYTGMVNGRLTLTSGLPVTTADVTAATTIYFTPYEGNYISLYDGSTAWTVLTFAETSLALGTLTATLPYDVFAYNNSGTLALEALAWTNGTTRATALTRQDGVLVKTGATTRRYLGTFYTVTTTTTEDSILNRFVWNYYNRVAREMRVIESTASWAYTTATWRQARATAGNKVSFVVGYAEDMIHGFVNGTMINGTGGASAFVGMGLDSTSALATGCVTGAIGSGDTSYASGTSIYSSVPVVGVHYLAWLEYSVATGTTTWYSGSGPQMSGMNVTWKS